MRTVFGGRDMAGKLVVAEPLAETQRRIRTALGYLRAARARGDPTIEWAWQQQFDELLDRYPRNAAAR